MAYFPPLAGAAPFAAAAGAAGAGAAPAGAAPGAPGAPPAPGGPAFASAAFTPVCPRNSRVGENSPSLCPTMFSVTYTGMNLFPLWTANVWPTNSGVTVLDRDQVLV